MTVPAQIGSAVYNNRTAAQNTNSPTAIATHRNYTGSGGYTMNHAIVVNNPAGSIGTQGSVTAAASHASTSVPAVVGVASNPATPVGPVVGSATRNFDVTS